MVKRLSIAGSILILLAVAVMAQDGTGFSLSLDPAVSFPMPGTQSAERFSIGAQASLSADYVLPGLPFLVLGGSIDYALAPYSAPYTVQKIGLAGGAGIRLKLLPGLSATAYGRGGYALGMLGAVMAPNPYLRAGVDMTYYLTPSFRLSLRGEYVHEFALSGPLYQGIAAGISAGFNFSQMNQRSNVEIRDIIITPVFPVFYKYYNDNAVGSAKIKNNENGPIRDVRVSFFVKQYMDAPKECAVIPEMKRGEEREVKLYALFAPSILSVLEPTKAQAEVAVSYTFVENARGQRSSVVTSINHRNGMTWEDDMRVASFATVNDPSVLRFSKQVAGLARSSGWQPVDASFRQALGIMESMALYGIRYVADPNTPFVEYSKNASAVDYLQFPIQTLEFRAGDCDDLSILSCALLEAAGIETAFITIPGHIYIAFALGQSPDDAEAFFSRPEDLIKKLGKAWVPVEVTALQDGFLRSWQLGAREWRDGVARGEAGFFSTHDAWKLYMPVALIEGGPAIELPGSSALLDRYTTAMKAFIDREIGPRVEKIKTDISAAKQDPKPVNRLGILYARYGVYDKAEESFRASLKAKESAAAYVNLGNVLILKKDFKAATGAFESALRLAPNDAKAILGLVRAAYEMEDRAASGRWLDQLSKIAPSEAEKLSYVKTGDTSTARASEAGQEVTSWEE